MLFRFRRQDGRIESMTEHEMTLAFERVRTHWATCDSCRRAASASSALWCPQGLELMRLGVTEDPHWETCAPCRKAQELVQSGQCEEGRELEERYRVLARRLAGA